jgi:spermidine synthase
VGYLYTREYYQSIREHLTEGGVVCQWMPIYQISPLRLRSAIKTFQEVFPNATLWYVENHALLVARLGSPVIDFALLQRKFADPAVREDLASIEIGSPEALLSHLLMGPEEIRAFVAAGGDVPTNTDDYPYLEYFVPGDLFYTVEENASEFARHLSDPRDFVRGIPPESAARLAVLAADRERWLVSP